jgi:hypothetical protein
MDGKLGVARPKWPLHASSDDESNPLGRTPKLGGGDKHGWWLRHWPTFERGGRRAADEYTLPRKKTDFGVIEEGPLLAPVLFGDDLFGARRRAVARQVQNASANDHLELCQHLAASFEEDQTVALLPQFSRLADAGMELMDVIAAAVNKEGDVPLSTVAASSNVAELCAALNSAAQEWRSKARLRLRHIESANRFAKAITSARPRECIKTLLEYHELYGGGLRWFVLRKGSVEVRTPPLGNSSRYRFRLWSLCRLAAQCGLLKGMPSVLRDDESDVEDPSSDDVDE